VSAILVAVAEEIASDVASDVAANVASELHRWAGFEPTLAIPVAGALVASHGDRFVIPLGIMMAAGQSAGLIMLIAGAAKMSDAASAPSSRFSSLHVMPYASSEGFGIVTAGRF
jgi:hypothetical protein